MLGNRREARRKNARAFQPTLGDALESRALLSHVPGTFFLKHPKAGYAFKYQQPPFLSAGAPRFHLSRLPRGPHIATETAHGGQTVIVGTPDGSHFRISLTQFIPPPGEGQTNTSTTIPGQQNPIQGLTPGASVTQPIGTVRAYAMPGGRVGLILDGTTTQSELDISPQPFPQLKGYAHSFAYGQSKQSHLLNIGQITVTSGQISAILGYHTADLSGPLILQGTTPVDRIAFQDLLPGAEIVTGGDLNTLDVLNNVNLNSGLGIFVGRDLNLLNVGQDVSLSNGANLFVSRFLGLNPQPPKGTATGSNFLAVNQALIGTGTSTIVPSLSGNVGGNIIIGPGSAMIVGGGIANSSLLATANNQAAPAVFLVNGIVDAPQTEQIVIPNLLFGPSIVRSVSSSGVPTFNNFVARQGSNNPQFQP